MGFSDWDKFTEKRVRPILWEIYGNFSGQFLLKSGRICTALTNVSVKKVAILPCFGGKWSALAYMYAVTTTRTYTATETCRRPLDM